MDASKRNPEGTLELIAYLAAVLFTAAGIWMLTLKPDDQTIRSFFHAVGVFSIAMAAIPLLLRRR